MKPSNSITLDYTKEERAGSSEELTTLTTSLKTLDIDPNEESEDHDLNFECKDEVGENEPSEIDEYQPINAMVARRDCLVKKVEKEKREAAEHDTEKPAATYIVNTEEWESLRRQMEEDNICYTSAKRKRDEIEIRVSDKQEHHNLICYLLRKGIAHKTFLTRHVEEMPEFIQELRRRKNKAQRVCQIYPSQENKRLANSLTRIFRKELANLRFNKYENWKCIILHFKLLEKQNIERLKNIYNRNIGNIMIPINKN